MDNYSPELERAQLLEEFKLADAKYATATIAKNDARLERAKWLLKIQESFPVTKDFVRRQVRAGFKEWCAINVALTFHTITTEIGFARDPERLSRDRAKAIERGTGDNRYRTPARALRFLAIGWPLWDDEQRQKIINRVLEYARAS